MKWERFLPALCAGVVTLTSAAGAVTVDWDDLTDAQQKAAYESLESENESLKEQLSALRSQASASGGDQAASGGDQEASGGDETSGETQKTDAARTGDASGGSASAAGGQIKDAETFLGDLQASFQKRQEAAASVTQDQLSQMSQDQIWQYRFDCAEAERDFYDTYYGAQFDSLNVMYLCTEYCGGLGKQYKAEESYKSGDTDKAAELYTAGYYNRAYALVEFHDYYGLDLADGYQNLRDAVSKMDAASGEENRNSSVDAGTVKKVQELLNQLGFLCGEPDGIPGRQTVSCIERFQVMYGYTPADGVIDDGLIGQMQDITAKQGG